MFGRSIYLSNYDSNFKVDEYADIYFTSFHIEEEFNDTFEKRAKALLKTLKDAGKKVIVDISPKGVKQLGYKNLCEFVQNEHIDVIRLDYGFQVDEMLEVGKYATVALNASTIDEETIDTLSKNHVQIMAIHNFYPRKDTGLDSEYLLEKNKVLKEKNVLVGCFIAGDENYRGPLYEGLPTLEEHRFLKPYVQYLELSILYGVDMIMVGDYGISEAQEELIKDYIETKEIKIPVKLDDDYHYLFNTTYTNRIDSPKGLIRIQESREYATKGTIIEPSNMINRTRGSITIDNKDYLRYSGEVQIMKDDYPMCERVNVIGKVDDDYLKLIDLVKRNGKLKLIEHIG